jgi:hypothetical protein
VALVVLRFGLGLRKDVPVVVADTAGQAPQVVYVEGAPAPAPVPPEPIKRADDAELAKAMALGVEGLLPLSEQFPKDPAVLKALATQFASKATGLADAMVLVQRLFEVAPSEVHDETLQFLILKASKTPGEASKLAYELMTQRMGGVGADVLYSLTFTSPKQVDEALAMLKEPKVRELFSPALAIAYELRTTEGCAEKLPLLERAAQLGDERSVMVLSPLAAASKKGCGKWKNKPCKASCADEAPDFLKAIRAIQARQEAISPK